MAKSHVKEWQTWLYNNGANIKIDGAFGTNTLNASYKAVQADTSEDNDTEVETPTLDPEQVTEYFKWTEFKCKDGTEVPESLKPNVILLCETILEPLRAEIGHPIVIQSGYRTQSYNDRIYGKSNTSSMHIYAGAADIYCKEIGRQKLNEICKKFYSKGIIGGLGTGDNCTHIDIRHIIDKTKYPYANYKAQWTY